MVPGAPVGFRVGSLDMGGLRAKDTKKEEKVEAVETGDKKNQKNWLQSSLDFGDFWDRAKLTSPKSKSPKSRLYVCNKWAQELTK